MMLTDEACRTSDEDALGPNSSKGPGLNPVQTCWHVLGHVSTPGWVSRLGPKRFASIYVCVLHERHSSIPSTFSFNCSPMPRECLTVGAELRAFLYIRVLRLYLLLISSQHNLILFLAASKLTCFSFVRCACMGRFTYCYSILIVRPCGVAALVLMLRLIIRRLSHHRTGIT